MFSLLLALIYVSFISLGLPDSLLGSAWPSMYADVGAAAESAGLITMVIAIGTIISSLFTGKLTHKLGTGLVTSLSVALTALALFGFSFSTSLPMLLLIAIPFGLGAGAVDAALNNYVALHFSSKHMNWLHAFWGVGASISPYIMSLALTGGAGWMGGYRTVAIIQSVICFALFISLKQWKRDESGSGEKKKHISIISALKIPGVAFTLLAFFAYCGAEFTIGVYAATYLVEYRGISAELAASYASFMYIGIMTGRFLCGFISNKMGDKRMIRGGLLVIFSGIILMLIPTSDDILSLSGLIVIGLGCAPIYPAIIHSTPAKFGEQNSAAIIGIEMASAYTGTTLIPPLFGLMAGGLGMGIFPYVLLALALLTLAGTAMTYRIVSKQKG